MSKPEVIRATRSAGCSYTCIIFVFLILSSGARAKHESCLWKDADELTSFVSKNSISYDQVVYPITYHYVDSDPSSSDYLSDKMKTVYRADSLKYLNQNRKHLIPSAFQIAQMGNKISYIKSKNAISIQISKPGTGLSLTYEFMKTKDGCLILNKILDKSL